MCARCVEQEGQMTPEEKRYADALNLEREDSRDMLEWHRCEVTPAIVQYAAPWGGWAVEINGRGIAGGALPTRGFEAAYLRGREEVVRLGGQIAAVVAASRKKKVV